LIHVQMFVQSGVFTLTLVEGKGNGYEFLCGEVCSLVKRHTTCQHPANNLLATC
jgi:hypothetical protein